jgi:hypothetical protein
MMTRKMPCFPVGEGRVYGDLFALALFTATVATLVAQFRR